jgi:3-dehydroquinate synthase
MAGLLVESVDERVVQLLNRLGFTLWHEALRQKTAKGQLSLLQGLVDFQEHLGGELTITLLADIGRGVEVHEMNVERIKRCIDWLQQQAQTR